MHGMPLGLLVDGVLDANTARGLPGFQWLFGQQGLGGPRLMPESLVYVGLRDVDLAERHFIRKLGIKAFTMYDIDHYGIGAVMDQALDHLLGSSSSSHNHSRRPLHISYDIDAVDPHLAPATGTAVRGGLTYREAHFVAERVAQTGNLASADIVELNPALCGATTNNHNHNHNDNDNSDGGTKTVDLALQLITSMLGKSIL
eukprot:CAMPEP_0202476796 /NCGR_PEP_ID=MMETSP1360-20130828/93607_1 /ASSEMBLY_ACC=CAM_ASM_000848 /TAXON_ID=515479 /ORGANISM="Licmophora paradoxa, Strain CCMP2313" /LENGTH=200 /DNA_ID=CAMNT_0049104011 /DNA_START=783 /DNA_END=1385 /DNA_ORIENTATION=-